MHIEPGFVAQAKIVMANVAMSGVLLAHARKLLQRPADLIRTLIAAVVFSVFMESFSVQVGPSELHFVGAMAIYLAFGFAPTLFGFALGLLLQGLLFNQADLMHLSVNSLSLILPLIMVHALRGRFQLQNTIGSRANVANIIKLDAIYYSGVVTMVGFWLAMSEVATPFAAWASFAASYLAVVMIEPLLTWSSLKLVERYQHSRLVKLCFSV